GDCSSIEAMADGLADRLRRHGHDDLIVVGMSLGGSVAQALTIRHPDLVGALGLVDTTAWDGAAAPAAWRQRAQRARQDGLASLAEFQLDRWFTAEFRLASAPLCTELLRIFTDNSVDSYVAACTAMGAMDLRPRLAEIAVPTAIVVGELDEAT